MSVYRYALVSRVPQPTAKDVAPYLPPNYEVLGETSLGVVIRGKDRPGGGFGLDNYVIPRLGSGMFYSQEVDLSHPCMKELEESYSRADPAPAPALRAPADRAGRVPVKKGLSLSQVVASGVTLDVHPGDYFKLRLPDGTVLKVEQTADDFSVTREDGEVAYTKPISGYAKSVDGDQERVTGRN